MITNERQYKITRSAAERFRSALAEFNASTADRPGVHPRLVQVERESMESQLSDLDDEIQEYERLKSSQISLISVDSFEELPDGLIKARIASGLSQKALAERLGVKEQQIQRYESERYASASLQRLQQIASALEVRVRNDLLMPVPSADLPSLVNKLHQVGIDREFFVNRLLPSSDAATIDDLSGEAGGAELLGRVGEALERIFGWTRENLFGAQALDTPTFATAEARFKMPASRKRAKTSVYAAYANYLAVIALKGAQDLPARPIPTAAASMRKLILERYGQVDLRSTLHTAWDLGVVVLPLRDRGTFHGACWRYEGRNSIVLKQSSKHEARWLFDLLHELFHAGQDPDAETLELIEQDETSSERRNSEEEVAASMFAGDVVLDGRAEEIAQTCVKAARGSVQRLKGVVSEIADRFGVDLGSLANYLAFRLSWQGLNWWGAAANLQANDEDPWAVAREVFIERFPYKIDDKLDMQLLNRALHGANYDAIPKA